MTPTVRNTEIPISRAFLEQILEEKIDQFGFRDDDQIVKIDLSMIPETFFMKVKHTKEKEVEVVRQNFNGP